MSEYPQHDKLKALNGANNTIGNFVTWLRSQGYTICRRSLPGEWNEGQDYVPVIQSVEGYRGKKPLRAYISTWANRYPDHIVLLATASHALVAYGGRVYDSWTPHGEKGDKHPFRNTTVRYAVLVQKRA